MTEQSTTCRCGDFVAPLTADQGERFAPPIKITGAAPTEVLAAGEAVLVWVDENPMFIII